MTLSPTVGLFSNLDDSSYRWISDLREGLVNGTLGKVKKIKNLTQSGTLGLNDELVLIDASAGNITLTLPSHTKFDAREIVLFRVDSSSNTVTVQSDTSILGGNFNIPSLDNRTVVAITTEWIVYRR